MPLTKREAKELRELLADADRAWHDWDSARVAVMPVGMVSAKWDRYRAHAAAIDVYITRHTAPVAPRGPSRPKPGARTWVPGHFRGDTTP